MARTVTVETSIAAPADRVWTALTDPEIIQRYMFGSKVVTDWQPGSPIVWKGEWQGKAYEDKGVVLDVAPGKRLEVTHFSPLTGQPDVPENYHRLSYELDESAGQTRVRLTQDGAGSDEEAEHSAQNWRAMLEGLKGVVEGGSGAG